MASTLIDAESSCGPEICDIWIFLVGFLLRARLDASLLFFRAAVAAAAFLPTSSSKSTSEVSNFTWPMDGVPGALGGLDKDAEGGRTTWSLGEGSPEPNNASARARALGLGFWS
jgi:hypothetical protein